MQDNEKQKYIGRDGVMASRRDMWGVIHPWCAVMSHQAAYMTEMQRWSESLRERVGRVDNARDVAQYDVTVRFPFLNRKVLYVNVTRPRCGTTGIDHENSSLVIFV